MKFIGEIYHENDPEIDDFFESDEVDEVSEWTEGQYRSETTYTIYRNENGAHLLCMRDSFPESVRYSFIEIINSVFEDTEKS